MKYVYVHGFVAAEELDSENLLASDRFSETYEQAAADARENGEGWEVYALVPAETLDYPRG